jgi:hypothetical protein
MIRLSSTTMATAPRTPIFVVLIFFNSHAHALHNAYRQRELLTDAQSRLRELAVVPAAELVALAHRPPQRRRVAFVRVDDVGVRRLRQWRVLVRGRRLRDRLLRRRRRRSGRSERREWLLLVAIRVTVLLSAALRDDDDDACRGVTPNPPRVVCSAVLLYRFVIVVSV